MQHLERTGGRPRGSWLNISHQALITLPAESRIILRSSDLECGSPAAAFLIDTHDSVFGQAHSIGTRTSVRSKSSCVSRRLMSFARVPSTSTSLGRVRAL